MTIQPTNPSQATGQYVQLYHHRQVLAAWVRVAVAMLSRDVEDLIELRLACERAGTFDQVQRISHGIDELLDARRELESSLDELIPINPPPEARS